MTDDEGGEAGDGAEKGGAPTAAPLPGEPGSLAEAAAAADSEIAAFEGLTASLKKIELNSEKSLLRAARMLNEAIAAQGRIAECLPVLLVAFSSAQRREQAAAERLEAAAQLIQARTRAFSELVQSVAVLGQEAIAITGLLSSLGSPELVGTSNGGGEFAARLQAVVDRMDGAVQSAKELHRRAVAEGVNDIARQADSLHQQLAAARAKLAVPSRSSGPA